MSKKFFRIIVLTCAMAAVSLTAGEIAGIPVFTDDFSVQALFVENWEPSRGVTNEDGKAVIPAGNNMTLRRIPEGDFAATADITLHKNPEDPLWGMFGVKLGGWINFLITASPSKDTAGAHTAYRVPGEEHSRGKRQTRMLDFEFGKPIRIMVSREKVGETLKYSYTVNGQPIDAFTVDKPEDTGKIMFFAYKNNVMSVDNFQLYALKSTGSRNLVVNSSFEHLQEGMPLYMKPLTRRKYRFEGKWEDFMNAFSIDRTEKVSGNQSIKITLNDNFPGPVKLPLPAWFSGGVGTHDVSATMGKPVTLSVYLKASEDNFPVKLGIWELWSKGHSKEITVSKEWQRYSFTIEEPEQKAIVRGNVTFGNRGTLWADDMQIEIGSEMTPYMPSSLDRDKFADVKESVPVEEDISVGRTPEAPVIDGTIEDMWIKYGGKTDRFFFKNSKPLNRTEAWLMCDADNLYIAVRAHVAETSAVKGSKLGHDNLAAHSEDCIEVLLDTSMGKKEYYHLTVNSAGSKTDMGNGRVLAWNGDWEAAVRINEKESSIDYEMRYPLSNFAGLQMAGRWGLNMGRNDTATQQFPSLTHTQEINFHVPELFPVIVFPEGLTDKYKIGARNLFLASGNDGKMSVSGTIVNMTDVALDSEIVILDSGTGEVIGKQKGKIPIGNTEMAVPVTVASDVKAMDCTVRLLVDGRMRLSQAQRVNLKRQLEVYTRYNYYMNEEAAVLVGSLNLPGADRMTGKITVAGKEFSVKMEPDFAIDIPLKGIPDGEHAINLDVHRGAEKVVSGSAGLVKRPFKAGATQIDRQRRCLVVDGKPYLVIAPFFGMEVLISAADQDKIHKNMLRLHKEMGYRCFHFISINRSPYQMRPNQITDFFSLCEEEGIKIINWSTSGIDASPEETFSTADNDNIIGWQILDEPDLWGDSAKKDNVEQYMNAHRAASPYTPVFMNLTIIGIPGRFANLATDIIMLDDYLTNRENRKVVEMINATNMMMEAGRVERKPVFYFLAGENISNHYREPTYAEQVAQTYGVIIAGGRGVSYFCSLPFHPEDYRACVDVNRELLSLEDAIFSLEKTSSATISNPAVISMTCRLNGRIYVIALNSANDLGADVEIVLPAEFRYTGHGNVVFEDRQVVIRNGRIADRFEPLARHVYVATIMD